MLTGAWWGRRKARCERETAVVRQHEEELHRLTDNHAAALAEREALATELKAYARFLIASSLGDPVATEALVRHRPTASGDNA